MLTTPQARKGEGREGRKGQHRNKEINKGLKRKRRGV